jgi:alpha-amylase
MLRLVVAVRVVAPAGGPARAIDLLVAEGLVPLLQSIDTLPGLAIAFSAGVPFWEQLRQRHPTVASGLGSLIEAGRIEPLGGPAFDVVLAGVPRRDRIGQVAAQLDWSEESLGVRPTCGWVPHQVWEPSMADDLVEAGLESTILLPDPSVTTRSPHSIRSGWFHTESDGRLLGVLPADETLAGLLAEGNVDDLPGRLEACCHELGEGPVVLAMKWTEQSAGGRSLARLLKWLAAGSDWDLVTPSEALRQTGSRGRYSLPAVGKPGGSWRLERDRDPVASKLHARLLCVSRRIDTLVASREPPMPLVTAARWGLYKAQGAAASGTVGVPGPESLAEARRLMLEAERLTDRIETGLGDRQAGWVEVTAEDFSLDGRTEVRLQSERLTAWVDPTHGRGFHELDLRDIGLSLPLLSSPAGADSLGGPHAWLLEPGASRDNYIDGTARLLSMGPQGGQITLERPDGSAWMCWESDAGTLGPRIDWRIGMEAGDGGRLLLEGRVAGLEPGALRHLGVELPLGTGSCDDSYGYDREGQRMDLESLEDLPEGDWLGLIEEQTGVDWSLGWFPRTEAWRVRGATTQLVVPHWTFQADEAGRWEFRIELTVDTCAAQARQLGRRARRAA